MFPHALRRPHQGLPLTAPELLIVALADHPAPGVVLVRRQVGDLDQHGGHQLDALQELQVDVHVEGHLPGLLNLLLLAASQNPFMLSLRQKTLSDQLFTSSSKLDAKKGIVSILGGSMSEARDRAGP
jgi:hypothetical protein